MQGHLPGWWFIILKLCGIKQTPTHRMLLVTVRDLLNHTFEFSSLHQGLLQTFLYSYSTLTVAPGPLQTGVFPRQALPYEHFTLTGTKGNSKQSLDLEKHKQYRVFSHDTGLLRQKQNPIISKGTGKTCLLYWPLKKTFFIKTKSVIHVHDWVSLLLFCRV